VSKQGDHLNNGGETPGRRDAMARMAKQLREHGNTPEHIREVTQRCANKADRIAERRNK